MPSGKLSNNALPWTMRFFALMNIITGLGFIIFACILEFPVKTAVPV